MKYKPSTPPVKKALVLCFNTTDAFIYTLLSHQLWRSCRQQVYFYQSFVTKFKTGIIEIFKTINFLSCNINYIFIGQLITYD